MLTLLLIKNRFAEDDDDEADDDGVKDGVDDDRDVNSKDMDDEDHGDDDDQVPGEENFELAPVVSKPKVCEVS